MTRPVAALFVTALLTTVMSACQSGGAEPSPGSVGSTAPGGRPQQIAALAREYAQCVRDHGIPNFPDPTISDGNVSYAGGDSIKTAVAAHPEAIAACKSIQDRLSQVGGKNWRPTARDLQKLVEFAKCIREHGVPEWPDPDADGRFTVSAKLEDENPETRIYPAHAACKGYWDGAVDFHGSKK
ncbi:hypothetical protein HDA40_000675 [Hamadaea flava]|uniref:Lipoprotein n=1 Tax=Hamadaea flava TaxID=1742688 RepID=A0ABV8M0Q7_9ACTN|nr:hypothetical protein [Hamadaea flava]MCP2322168.1 hypothetical protein [Hamadaea flava]